MHICTVLACELPLLRQKGSLASNVRAPYTIWCDSDASLKLPNVLGAFILPYRAVEYHALPVLIARCNACGRKLIGTLHDLEQHRHDR